MSILPAWILNISAQLEQCLPAQPCVLCGADSSRRAWCDACDAALPYLPTERCPLCAQPTPDGQICGRCLKRPPPFDRTVAAFAYAFPLDQLVQALKFRQQLILAHSLADALLPRIQILPDCLLPMPLHPARLYQRGFNQSLELARPLARQLNIPLLTDACQRIRDTAPQSGLPWKQRRQNIRQAFACPTDFSGRHVAIVDDVVTTAYSASELARTLRQAGASEISLWVIARTLPHPGKRD